MSAPAALPRSQPSNRERPRVSDAPVQQNFNQVISAVEDGHLHNDLSDKLRDLVGDLENAATQRGGKAAGTFTLTLKLSLEGGIMEIAADIATKAPKPKRGRSIFYVTPENNLTRRDPRQPDLPLRDVSVAPARGLA